MPAFTRSISKPSATMPATSCAMADSNACRRTSGLPSPSNIITFAPTFASASVNALALAISTGFPSLANWIIANVLPSLADVSNGPIGLIAIAAIPAWKFLIAVSTQSLAGSVETLFESPPTGVLSELLRTPHALKSTTMTATTHHCTEFVKNLFLPI